MSKSTKLCLRCLFNKPLEDFYRRRGRSSGRQPWCKVCSRLHSIEWKRNNLARARESSRKTNQKYRNRLRSEGRPRKSKPHTREQHKVSAAKLVHLALANGDIVKPKNCERCRKPHQRLHAHHKDYRKPLVVIWLCPPCHGVEHRL